MAGSYGWELWLGVREAWACRRAPVRADATLHLHGRAQERAHCPCFRTTVRTKPPTHAQVAGRKSFYSFTDSGVLPPGQYGRLGPAAPPSLLSTSMSDASANATCAALLPKRAAPGGSGSGSGDAAQGDGWWRRGGAVLPPSQQLVRVTGSVREVRVWDALSGVVLEDHSGPVTSISLVQGALVTLAMGDGLIASAKRLATRTAIDWDDAQLLLQCIYDYAPHAVEAKSLDAAAIQKLTELAARLENTELVISSAPGMPLTEQEQVLAAHVDLLSSLVHLLNTSLEQPQRQRQPAYQQQEGGLRPRALHSPLFPAPAPLSLFPLPDTRNPPAPLVADAPTGAALLPKRAAAAGSVDAAHLGRRRRGGAVLPPSQRLVRVTGSVREVRVWDALSGVALEGHSGPVTTISLVHGALVTLAMGDGLIVYKCNGLDTPPTAPAASSASSASSTPGLPEQATAAATAAAAAMENNSIPKVLKDNNLIIDATELGKLNTKSASCAVQLATPAMDAIDCVPLLKGCLGSLEFSLKPGCWLDLKIAILVKDKGWRWFPTRLTSLELLDSAYNGGLRGRFPSVLTMAAALEDFEMGIITIDSLMHPMASMAGVEMW
eukprot:XP_001696270.1 predicted protein [Chlamydomonas reinhardtii]